MLALGMLLADLVRVKGSNQGPALIGIATSGIPSAPTVGQCYVDPVVSKKHILAFQVTLCRIENHSFNC
jgi:hypothetical protein